MPKPNSHPKELRERAVRMVAEIGEPSAIRRVAEHLGVSQNTVRYWVTSAPKDKGGKAGLTTEQLEELKELRKEVTELRRANEILRAASSFFAKELDRPRTKS